MLDPFRNLTNEETKKKVNDWWEDLEYLIKIKILLKVYEGYSITKLESRGIAKMWKAISLERKKELCQDNWKY